MPVHVVSPTPSDTTTSAGYTFVYSGATTYSCSTVDFPGILGQLASFEFINDSSVAIEVGDQTVAAGGSYTPADARFGDIYEVLTDTGSCLIYFGQTGSGQVTVS